jgi:hypothetical protein
MQSHPQALEKYRGTKESDDRSTMKRDGIGPSVQAMTKPDSPLRRLGAAAMALATAFAVVACGSGAGNSAAPAAAGSHSAHAGGASAPPQPRGVGMVDELDGQRGQQPRSFAGVVVDGGECGFENVDALDVDCAGRALETAVVRQGRSHQQAGVAQPTGQPGRFQEGFPEIGVTHLTLGFAEARQAPGLFELVACLPRERYTL